MEARIGLCRCREGKKTYGIRFQAIDDGWEMTWAFPIKEHVAKREGYVDTKIVGNIEVGKEYPGCPYCGVKYFVVCGCGKLTCNNFPTGDFKCEWCGTTGTLEKYGGKGFSAGGDI